MTGEALLELRGVSQYFRVRSGILERLRRSGPRRLAAVRDVDLAIRRGEVVALVGESGCGKSTLGRIVAGLQRPSTGDVVYRGAATATLRGRERLAYVLGVQMIFQDPQSSLDPRQRLRDIVGEALLVHHLVPKADIPARVDQVLGEVGLDRSYRDRYPRALSGGQKQRVGIARALAVQPAFLVCDEPVAALDVSIQAQVINLFMDLREQRGLTYLFISHDLSVVRHIADRVAIMYLGRIVELAPTAALFAAPNHPYTQALLAEIPSLERRRTRFQTVRGEVPSPLAPPPGCAFHPRCPRAMPVCREREPPLVEIAAGRQSACHLNGATAA
jgi:peptide/nickel transport system ATP-binding protein